MTYSSLPRAEPHLCCWHPLLWLLGVGCTWRARGRWIVSSQLNSAQYLKRRCCLRGPGPKLLPSFFSILCLRRRFSALGGCLVLSKAGSAVPWSSWKGASAASSHCFSSCLVPSTASCAEIFNSPAASVLGRRQELYTAPLSSGY